MKTIRILIAEDNPHEFSLLETGLQDAASRAGNLEALRIDAVADGPSTLERLRQDGSLFQLALLDANLPALDTHAVLTRLREEGGLPPIPIIILSSMIAESSRQEFLALGATRIYDKPMDLDELDDLSSELLAVAIEAVRS